MGFSRTSLVVLAWITVTAVVVLAEGTVSTSDAMRSVCQDMLPSPVLEKFVDELIKPQKVSVSSGQQVVIGAYKIQQKLHRDLPPTTMYAYGRTAQTASYPGPTLEAIKDIPSHIRWENHLHDPEHMFMVDRSLMWANPKSGGVPHVTHLHGIETESKYDGYPDAWSTASGEYGMAWETHNYTYPNSQWESMLWYHDHSYGITRLNIVAGLAGLYFIRSKAPPPTWMPHKNYEVPLLLQDKQIHANGSINFPNVGLSVKNHPNWCPEYFGDVILVNGKAWPFMVVKPRKYRFRVLNGANARVFELALSTPKMNFTQIGSDGGLLEHPQDLDLVTLAPAERVDFIIDFAAVPGEDIILHNSAIVPYPDGDPIFTPESTRSVMMFKVKKFDADDAPNSPAIPMHLREDDPVVNITGAPVHTHTMIELADEEDYPIGSLLDSMSWHHNATELPVLGSTEIWEFINLTPDAHPMHVHLIKFKVLNLQPFNLTLYEEGGCDRFEENYRGNGSCITGDSVAPLRYHAGWKDTVVSLPGFITRVVLVWKSEYGGDFAFDATAKPGYLWHCHILDHEDNDMMRPVHLQPKA